MFFQSPPFWCLMTTQEFAIAYRYYDKVLDLQKVDGAPPRCVHIWNMHLYTNAHILEEQLPLDSTNHAHMQLGYLTCSYSICILWRQHKVMQRALGEVGIPLS